MSPPPKLNYDLDSEQREVVSKRIESKKRSLSHYRNLQISPVKVTSSKQLQFDREFRLKSIDKIGMMSLQRNYDNKTLEIQEK